MFVTVHSAIFQHPCRAEIWFRASDAVTDIMQIRLWTAYTGAWLWTFGPGIKAGP